MTLLLFVCFSHKEIALINFSLHETHCSRFLCLCPDCNEAVPRDQLSEHRKEQHSKVNSRWMSLALQTQGQWIQWPKKGFLANKNIWLRSTWSKEVRVFDSECLLQVRCCKCHQKMEQCQLQDHEVSYCIYTTLFSQQTLWHFCS